MSATVVATRFPCAGCEGEAPDQQRCGKPPGLAAAQRHLSAQRTSSALNWLACAREKLSSETSHNVPSGPHAMPSKLSGLVTSPMSVSSRFSFCAAYFNEEVITQAPASAPESYRRIDVSVKSFEGYAWLRLYEEG